MQPFVLFFVSLFQAKTNASGSSGGWGVILGGDDIANEDQRTSAPGRPAFSINTAVMDWSW